LQHIVTATNKDSSPVQKKMIFK